MIVTEDCLHYFDDFIALEIVNLKKDKKEIVLIDRNDLFKIIGRNIHVVNKKGVRNSLKYAMIHINNSRTYLHLYLQKEKPKKGFVVDHTEDTLDNRQAKMRVCSIVENSRRAPKCKSKKTSKYRGVYFTRGKFQSAIMVKRKKIYLGTFDNEDDAAICYNKAAKKYFGEFCYLNKVAA